MWKRKISVTPVDPHAGWRTCFIRKDVTHCYGMGSGFEKFEQYDKVLFSGAKVDVSPTNVSHRTILWETSEGWIDEKNIRFPTFI